MSDDKQMPERLSRETIFESDYLNLHIDRVRQPNGFIIERFHYVEYPHPAVGVVAENGEGKVVLCRVPRYTSMTCGWSVPAGEWSRARMCWKLPGERCGKKPGLSPSITGWCTPTIPNKAVATSCSMSFFAVLVNARAVLTRMRSTRWVGSRGTRWRASSTGVR